MADTKPILSDPRLEPAARRRTEIVYRAMRKLGVSDRGELRSVVAQVQ